ncbi:hypothetical protein FRC08_001831, partial [Ceratobasidium sp. 394]
MGTHGWYAIRYKNKYYRQFARYDGYPSSLGREFASDIPRNAAKREAWIERTKAEQLKLHEELANPPADEDAPDVANTTVWITGEYDAVGWSYIIDLDYRAFSVNGQVHFKLDDMPRNPSFYWYFQGAEDRIHLIPEKHLTTVSYWPNPAFDVQKVSDAYDKLECLGLDLGAWGAPSWESLMVSQRLSVELVKMIVSDHKKTLGMADLMSEFGKVLLISWQVASAAAPSNVLCPAETPSSESVRYATTEYVEWNAKPDTYPYRINVNLSRISRPYCWFRGCLVKFCLRLDEDPWARFEIVRMAHQLRKNGRASGVGILMSSFQVVAVSVDGSEVRRSPVLDLHDGKGDIRDGLLLLVHLLGPSMIGRKVPWSPLDTVECSASSVLPEEVIQNVLRFADDETYHFVLPLVSRLVRSMCLARPRVGNFILTRANTDGTYQALSTETSGTETRVQLVRKDTKIEPGFSHVFQHHQIGVGPHSE